MRKAFWLIALLVSATLFAVALMVLDEMINGSLGWCPKPDSLINCVYEWPPPLHVRTNEDSWMILFAWLWATFIASLGSVWKLARKHGQ